MAQQLNQRRKKMVPPLPSSSPRVLRKKESTRVKNSKHLLQTTAVRFKPELSVHWRRSTRQNSNCRGHVLLYGEPTINLHRRELFQLFPVKH
ncbi:unnamed protein product [Brassica napus]|uniref:(rape) hypothetical protein n=1 Tax=Brassica napus TaxID=3708 RepID=A0A816X1Z3_BRANA|nr:unnamed protein product [Brassica napus]